VSTPEIADALASPVLSASELFEMATFGTEKTVASGELLFQAGEASYDLFVVLEGEAEIVRTNGDDEVVLVTSPLRPSK
jgi:thioredoxin reductase (NADPH)